MDETYVRLSCPDCQKDWEASPRDLPSPDREFECPDCGERRPTSEFTRTKQDLEVLQRLA